MNTHKLIQSFSTKIISEISELDKNTKHQLLKYVKEADTFELMALLLDGKVTSVSENAKPIIFERFKKSDISNKLKYFSKKDLVIK